MSIARGLAVFLLSSIFTLALFTAITSYTIGDLLQKDNLKEFIEAGMAPDLIENQCNDFCLKYEDRMQECMDVCIEEIGNNTDQTISGVIDGVYETDFYGITISQVLSILEYFLLFVAITVAAGVAIFFVSEEPLPTLGRNMLSISITLFIVALSPNFILSLSNVPLQEVFSDYMSQGLEMQMLLAIVIFVIAIVFLIADYLIKRKKTTKVPKKKKIKK